MGIRKILSIVVGLGFMLYLAFLFLPARIEQQRAADSFKPISAKVISSQVVRKKGGQSYRDNNCHRTGWYNFFHPSDYEDYASRKENKPLCHMHQPYIVYQYNVKGVSYQNDVYCISCEVYKKAEVEEMIRQKYNPGQIITVYVDPDDPQKSMVNNEDGDVPFYILSVFVVWVILGFSIFRLLRRPY